MSSDDSRSPMLLNGPTMAVGDGMTSPTLVPASVTHTRAAPVHRPIDRHVRVLFCAAAAIMVVCVWLLHATSRHTTHQTQSSPPFGTSSRSETPRHPGCCPRCRWRCAGCTCPQAFPGQPAVVPAPAKRHTVSSRHGMSALPKHASPSTFASAPYTRPSHTVPPSQPLAMDHRRRRRP